MYTINVTNLNRTYKNFGQHAEQCLTFTLTGEIRKADHVPYHVGSDIPEYHMSVKTGAFSLMSGNYCEGMDFEEIIETYMANTASQLVAFVSKAMVAYVMNLAEFNEFLHRFAYLTYESGSHKNKVACLKESKKMVAWLEARVG